MAFWNRPTPVQLVPVPALLGAAKAIEMSRERITPHFESWQAEAWKFYDDLGEFRYAIDWRAEMISRVRIRAGKIVPDADEPELVDSGPAAELIDSLYEGAAGGEPQLLRSFAVQLGVVGEGWLCGETIDPKTTVWRFRSADEIRQTRDSRAQNWEVIDDDRSMGTQEYWRQIKANSLVTRVWEPHPRKYHLADSPTRAARPTLRELELVNRHIQAGYLSRLASCGIVIFPSEISFPVRPEFADDPNPMVREWVETAKTAVNTPGTAAATIPIPMQMAGEYIDKVKFIDFTVKADDKILEKRDSAIRRLATQLDLPAEVLLGMGDVNHWSAWQLEESGIKVHILPMVERICEALYVGYLKPRLKASGVDPTEWTVWYDASEITIRPDRTAQAEAAAGIFAISEAAYLREVGLDENDAPDDDELKTMILKRLAADPTNALTALKALTGDEIEPVSNTPEPPPQEVLDPTQSPTATGQQGTPDTQNNPPPAPDAQAPAQAASGMLADLHAVVTSAQNLQRDMRHWLVKDLHGFTIGHPEGCRDLKVECPYRGKLPTAVPGRSGTYEVSLANGRLRVGQMRQDVGHANRRA